MAWIRAPAVYDSFTPVALRDRWLTCFCFILGKKKLSVLKTTWEYFWNNKTDLSGILTGRKKRGWLSSFDCTSNSSSCAWWKALLIIKSWKGFYKLCRRFWLQNGTFFFLKKKSEVNFPFPLIVLTPWLTNGKEERGVRTIRGKGKRYFYKLLIYEVSDLAFYKKNASEDWITQFTPHSFIFTRVIGFSLDIPRRSLWQCMAERGIFFPNGSHAL